MRLVIIMLFFFTTSFLSQDQKWHVQIITGKIISNVSLLRLSGDTLFVKDSIGTIATHVDSISEICFLKESGFWSGAETGFLIGGGTGAISGAVFSKPGGLIARHPVIYRSAAAVGMGLCFGTIGGLFGGIIGSASEIDVRYDFSNLDQHTKISLLRNLIEQSQKNKLLN